MSLNNINLKSERFKSDLYNLINNSDLPVANVYFICQLVFQKLENTYYGTLNDEINIESKNNKVDPEVNQDEMPEEITSKEELENNGTN